MTITLAVFAGVILIVYSPYFVRIIKGNHRDFELEILKALAEWIISRGTSSRQKLWGMLALSLLLEMVYILLAFLLINNVIMQFFTAFLAGIEIYHFIDISIHFNRFFRGQMILKEIFNWQVERISVVLYFTHSLLVLVVLVFF